MRATSRFAWLCPLGTALIWGVNIPIMKDALSVLHPFAFNALRLTLSAVVLALLVQLEPKDSEREPVAWARVVFVGLLGSLFYQLLFLSGMARTSAGHSALIIASQPLWTAVLSYWLTRENRSVRAWCGFGIAFCGTVLVVFQAGAGDGASVAGNLLVLAAALAWALATVSSKPLLRSMSPTGLALAFTLTALPFHWLLALGRLDPVMNGSLGLAKWGEVVYSGALSTGLAYILWNRGVRELGPSRTAIFANLVPVVALFVAWLYLSEVPGPMQLAGGGLVLSGLFLSQRR